MTQHARSTLEPGEVVHVVEWYEQPLLRGVSRTTVVLGAINAPEVKGHVWEFRAATRLAIGLMGKIMRVNNVTTFQRF